jgi:hypothetical protein
MKAPEYERRELLGAAIARATDELKAPIDRIEVTGGHIRCWAGSETVTLSYHYAQGGSFDSHGQFTAHVGSGEWQVEVVRDPASRRPAVIGRGLAKFLKRRGW